MPPGDSPKPRFAPIPEDPSLDAFLAAVRLDGVVPAPDSLPSQCEAGGRDLAALLLSLDLPGSSANAGPERGAGDAAAGTDAGEQIGRIGDGWEIEALAG